MGTECPLETGLLTFPGGVPGKFCDLFQGWSAAHEQDNGQEQAAVIIQILDAKPEANRLRRHRDSPSQVNWGGHGHADRIRLRD